jgi:hypothetical protein
MNSSLARCGMEELAARQQHLQPSAGISFARTRERQNKDSARQCILDLFAPARWPGRLHMLTLPGLDWRFERLLLAQREPGWLRAPRPRRTFFSAAENDRSIYFGAVARMPGSETPARVIKHMRIEFAELAVRTRYSAFFFANVDDIMMHHGWDPWDAVWLDYTGPLTIERLKLIQQFFQTKVRDTLIVTALKARWNWETSAAITAAGGHSQWLREHLFGEILHDIEYTDTAPMAQFAIRHPNDLGHIGADAHRYNAEIAAAGQKKDDAQPLAAGGGTNSNNLGHQTVDAHRKAAEIAAAGPCLPDAHSRSADGGTHSNDLGHRSHDAQDACAEIAAAGHSVRDAHNSLAGGGTNSNDLGQSVHDAQHSGAEIAPSANQYLMPTRLMPTAPISPLQQTKKGKSTCPAKLRQRPRKQPRPSAPASKKNERARAPLARTHRRPPPKKPQRLSARASKAKKPRARSRNP